MPLRGGKHDPGATNPQGRRSREMATLQSLIDAFNTVTSLVPPSLVAPSPPGLAFLGNDAITPPAGGYKAIYSFGDSLSDTGNVSFGTLRTIPVSPPYSGGRFTNGEVWVQTLSQELGLPAVAPSLAGGTNFAYGGARTGPTDYYPDNPTNLPGQIGQFVAAVPDPAEDALYTVWIGSNDVLEIANNDDLTPAQQSDAVQQAVNNEIAFIGGLITRGADDIVVLNVPDIGQTPYQIERGPEAASRASSLAEEYNTSLAAQLRDVVAASGAELELIDMFALLGDVVANPTIYGFQNATQPVWTGDVASSSSGTLNATGETQNLYVFFDELHPTARAHALLGTVVADRVIAQ